MKLLARIAKTVLAALVVAVVAAQPALAGALDVLSQQDARLYAAAFESARRGDFDASGADIQLVSDRGLVGYIELARLMHPSAYTATYPELTAWLGDYGDLPGAERVYLLAMKRRPPGAPAIARPAYMAYAPAADPASPAPARRGLSEAAVAARQAYYSGDLQKALALAPAAGQRWIAGLASYRLGRFPDAQAYFTAVAQDAAEDAWVRAGAGFWAARAAKQAGDTDAIEPMLKLAADFPNTFYGLIATRALALRGKGGGAVAANTLPPGFQQASYTPAPDANASARRLIETNPRAWRAAALTQIARPTEALLELRAGLAAARTDADRKSWIDLARTLSGAGAPMLLTPAVNRGPAPEEYPMPELFPTGGFTLDPALVYAITRQESRFNPYAVSNAGAMGLMQVRPDAAAHAAGDDQILTDPMPLFDGPTNLRIGQDHFTWLMEKLVGFDLLSAIAAYNCGPAPVMKLQKSIGLNDSLLLIESLPAGETREYVEHVTLAYWMYRRLMGHESPTLDALAGGHPTADLRLDYHP